MDTFGGVAENGARAIAERWLIDRGYERIIKVGASRETRRSFLFEMEAIGDEIIYNNYPIAVNKVTQEVTEPRDAWLEFVNPLPMRYRLRRWFARRSY